MEVLIENPKKTGKKWVLIGGLASVLVIAAIVGVVVYLKLHKTDPTCTPTCSDGQTCGSDGTCADSGETKSKDLVKKTSKKSGDKESGDKESGDKESGDKKSGDKESGDKKSGDKESGDNYKEESNTLNPNWGCQNPTPPGISSTSDPKEIQSFCNSRKECIGYYGGKDDNWYIATNTEPKKCANITNADSNNYTKFYRKQAGDKYKEEPNKLSPNWGCQNSTPKSSTDDLKEIQSFCNSSNKCIGYYGGKDDNWYIATNTEPKKCTNITNADNNNYTKFYRKQK